MQKWDLWLSSMKIIEKIYGRNENIEKSIVEKRKVGKSYHQGSLEQSSRGDNKYFCSHLWAWRRWMKSSRRYFHRSWPGSSIILSINNIFHYQRIMLQSRLPLIKLTSYTKGVLKPVDAQLEVFCRTLPTQNGDEIAQINIFAFRENDGYTPAR